MMYKKILLIKSFIKVISKKLFFEHKEVVEKNILKIIF